MEPYIFAGALYGIGQIIALLLVVLAIPFVWIWCRGSAKGEQIYRDYRMRQDIRKWRESMTEEERRDLDARVAKARDQLQRYGFGPNHKTD